MIITKSPIHGPRGLRVIADVLTRLCPTAFSHLAAADKTSKTSLSMNKGVVDSRDRGLVGRDEKKDFLDWRIFLFA